MFIIVEKKDIGGRDVEYRYLIATSSVYGGEPFPYFTREEDAQEFLRNRSDGYRGFEILSLELSKD